MLVFYSKSAHKPAGKGLHEHLASKDKFNDLNKIVDWRKMLSNMYVSPFILGDEKYNSVEHFFHASKFLKTDSQFAKTFTINSGSKWAVDPFKAKTAGKAGRISKNTKVFTTKDFSLPTNVKMRADFYDSIVNKVQLLAWYSKFTQNPLLKKVLLATGEARLFHVETVRGKQSKLIHFSGLEKVRDCIHSYPDVQFSANTVKSILK